MNATVNQELADLRRANAELREALARRDCEYGGRIEHQSIEVLKAMANSPGDPQPVFDLITRHAAEHCDSRAVLWEFDGTLMHFRVRPKTS